jgi:hypothetical protein
MVSMGDLKKLRIMVPTIEEQDRIEAENRQLAQLSLQLRDLEDQIARLTESAWPIAPSIAKSKARKR